MFYKYTSDPDTKFQISSFSEPQTKIDPICEDQSISEYYFEQLKSEDPFYILQGIQYFQTNLVSKITSNSFFTAPDVIQIIIGLFLNNSDSDIIIESLNFINNCHFLNYCQLESTILAELAQRCIYFLELCNEDFILPVLDLINLLSQIYFPFFQEIETLEIFNALFAIEIARFEDKISYLRKELSLIDLFWSHKSRFSTVIFFGRFEFYTQFHYHQLTNDIFLFLIKHKEALNCKELQSLIPIVYDIMENKLPPELQSLFRFLNEDQDYLHYFTKIVNPSRFTPMINDLIVSFKSDSSILISIFTLINQFPIAFFDSVSDNFENLLLQLLQILLNEDLSSRKYLCFLILKLLMNILDNRNIVLFLIKGGILNDIAIFYSVSKGMAINIFNKLKDCIDTNQLSNFEGPIKDLESVIDDLSDSE